MRSGVCILRGVYFFMSNLVRELLSAWEWRIDVVLVLFCFGTLYVRGWWTLRQKQTKLASIPRLVSYLIGLFSLMLSLLSPIDRLGGQLFFMHMIQHLLSIMIAAPLLLLASPFPMILWGMPKEMRKAVAGLFTQNALFRTGLALITKPSFAWFAFVGVYLGWHEPEAYNLALRREWVHDIEHITFFGAAMLYWWHALDAAPHIHKRMPAWGRGAFLFATIPPNMLTGVFIAFASQPVYTYYESVPRFWGFTVMQDQMLGGAIMWIPGSMMFLIAGLIVMAVAVSKATDQTVASQKRAMQKQQNSDGRQGIGSASAGA